MELVSATHLVQPVEQDIEPSNYFDAEATTSYQVINGESRHFEDIESLGSEDLSQFIGMFANILTYTEKEKSEITDHKFSSEIIFKDILRIGIGFLLTSILRHLGYASTSLEELTYELSRNQSERAKRVFSILFYLLEHWNDLLTSEIVSEESRLVREVAVKLKDILQQNMATLLGENVLWNPEILKNQELSHTQATKLKKLIDKNGLRQIQFNGSYDFAIMQYLLSTSIRCFSITRGEREAIEMSNELIKFLLRWSSSLSESDRNELLDQIKHIIGKDSKLLTTLEVMGNLNFEIGDMIIEISPPLYVTQKNLMVRIFTVNEIGYSVSIFHIPNTSDNGIRLKEQLSSFRGVSEIITYSQPSEPANLALSSLTYIPRGQTLLDIKSLLPIVVEYGDLVDLNDNMVQQNILDVVYSTEASAFAEGLITRTMNSLADRLAISAVARRYDNYIKSIFISSQNTKVEGLDEEAKQRVATDTREAVLNGSEFEPALSLATRSETSGSVSYIIDSEGPCVTINDAIRVGSSTDTKTEEPILVPNQIGDTTYNIMRKGNISVRTETTRTKEGLKTTMTCPVCQKGKFELFAECDAPKDYRCPVCRNDVLEMRAWWENSDQNGIILARKLKGAREKYERITINNKSKSSFIVNEIEHPNWADHLITFLTFGLFQPASASDTREQ